MAVLTGQIKVVTARCGGVHGDLNPHRRLTSDVADGNWDITVLVEEQSYAPSRGFIQTLRGLPSASQQTRDGEPFYLRF